MSPQERGALGAAKRWGNKQPGMPTDGERPVYRITQTCYCFDKIWDPDAQPKDDNGDPRPLYMEWDERPAYYMEPANEAAKAMYEKNPPLVWCDPIIAATTIK